ncbi:hypothetical protein DFH29DRAFT_1001163 [Suillus ampliporus]|nr:hypothetical protein DFH29DRAFT_1001163 [Suillus ampliporus]
MVMGKRKYAQTDEPVEIKESHCVWFLADESILIAYISSQRAKGGNGMNFNKTFWVAAAAELAAKGTGVATPVTHTSSHNANVMPHFLVPSLSSTSTPASSTAIKCKTVDNDSSCQESYPPHYLKLGKSAGGSSKSQHITMLLALEEFGGKVTSSIDTATMVLQEVIIDHFVELVPIHKQRAICQVQEEHDLDDHKVLKMIKVFQSDVMVANSYLNITQDGVRKLFLADYLQAHEKGSN